MRQSVEIGIADGEAARLAKVAERARANRTPDPTVGVRMMSERGGTERVIGVVLTVPFGTDYRSAMAATESANAAAAEAEALGVRRAVEQSAWVAAQAAESKRTQWQSFAQALAAQDEDAALKARFAPLAKALTDNEQKIVEELIAVQGKAVDIGGYYRPDVAKASKAMRPSATFNAALEQLRG